MAAPTAEAPKAIYRVEAPDGSILRIEAPDDASEEEVLRAAREQFTPKSQVSAPKNKPRIEAKISPEEQAERDAIRIEILKKELAKAQKQGNTGDVEALIRELERAGVDVSPAPPKTVEVQEPSTADLLRQKLMALEQKIPTEISEMMEGPVSPEAIQAAQLGASGIAAMGGYKASPVLGAMVKRVAEASQRPAFSAPGTPPVAPAAPVAATTAPLQPTPSQPAARATGSGSAVFNYGKAFGLSDIEAAKALDMTKQAGGAHDLATQRRLALNRIQNLFPTEMYTERPSGIMVPEQGAGRGPRASYSYQQPVAPSPEVPQGRPGGLSALPPRQAIPPVPAPSVSPLSQVSDMFRTIGRTGANLLADVLRSRYMGALGAGSAAYQGMEALKQLRAGQDEEAALSGMGALGGALMVIPTVPTALVGGALSAAPYAYRRYKQIRAEPPPQEPTEEELIRAQRPAFTPQRSGLRIQ